jgi:hypothetical protein
VKYNVGDIVHYQTFGCIETRRVMVTSKDDDIKNGRPGFDGFVIRPGETYDIQWDLDEDSLQRRLVWGYDDQIIAVEVAR